MIREARKEDAEQVVELFRIILTDMELPIMDKVSWEELKPALVEAAKMENYRQSYKNALVKDIDGQIAGFCFGYKGGLSDTVYEPLSTILDAHNLPQFETFMANETVPGEWYIDSIVTHPDFRGRGIGKELMEAAYKRARSVGMPVVGLNVDHDNPRAKALYEAQGFVKTGEITLAEHQYDHMQKKI
ncbi:MAG: GNAT family N-acetyltransferase [Alkalibacterium sp.]|nr:GNAT family N-acetyltransferase [Alkalibacterium sp.]TVP91029.1 MAG: GNAT family N-acetyltransferase [Alkalibacterium sp.]